MAPSIGLAITTFNRCEQLCRLISGIRRYCHRDIHLAVFDDGSGDSTFERVPPLVDMYLRAPNAGITVNKNRALYYFLALRPVDQILLLEDDVEVISSRWLPCWSRAVEKHGHINLSDPDWPREGRKFFGGRGTAASPEVWNSVTGACMASDAAVLRRCVGYLNPRFAGYGFEHIEWTRRFIKNGYGGYRRRGGRWSYYMLSTGMVFQPSQSSRDAASIARNAEVMAELGGVGDYVSKPWLDEAGRRDFLAPFARWWGNPARQKA